MPFFSKKTTPFYFVFISPPTFVGGEILSFTTAKTDTYL